MPIKNTRKNNKLKDIEFIIEDELSPVTTKLNTTLKLKPTNKRKKTLKNIDIEFIIEEEDKKESEKKETNEKQEEPKPIKKIEKSFSRKKSLKIPMEFHIMESRYNEQFIDLMEKLNNIMLKQGEPFRARAYQKAQETIMNYQADISDPKQLKGLPGIGETIMEKLKEYVETGTLKVLEREKTNPINILGEIYGIGPKKAEELVKAGIKTVDELISRQDELLNDIQKVGLKYHDQIMQRIPRSEIEEYEQMFKNVFNSIPHSSEDKFEIVGSYRRGAQTSGDIDVIITGKTGQVYKQFVDYLIKSGIILEVLSRGPSKTLVIATLLPTEKHVARRVDFLFTPPDEFAFAILYFTGSKIFNTVMRQYGLNKGYTFNEHGIYLMQNKKKGAKVEKQFATEKDIFDFLGLEFKTPLERIDGRAVQPISSSASMSNLASNLEKMDINKTNKNDKISEEEIIEVELKPKPKSTKTTNNKNTKPSNKKANKKITLDESFELVIEEEANKIQNEEINEKREKELMEIVNLFINKGIEVLDVLNEKDLSDIILLSNNKYYNQDPIMSDNQYDIIKEYIEKKFPSNTIIHEIGATVLKNKVKLPFTMASMDKIKPDTNALSNWTKKYKGPYVLSCKLDGVSGLYTTINSEPKLYTRGDGNVGQDVSHLIPHLRLPKTQGVAIRGEFIIPKETFNQKYKTTFANPRNMVAGIINNKRIINEIKDVHFVAYEVIQPELKPSEQMEYLNTLNVEAVTYKIVTNLTNDILSDLLVEWRQTSLYEIDGVIVTNDAIYPRSSGNPEHSFAFKMVLSDQIAEAKVIDVIWTPSKDGYLKPRVRIEPINLGGVTIEYATGFNAAFIEQNGIGIGATIQLIRSGDVIPYIKSVTIPSTIPKMPQVPFKWNDTHVDIMLENAAEDLTVKEKNITGFFKGLEVEGLSSGNVNKIMKAGYDTVPDIINMTVEDFLEVEGFKDKMANKLYNGIQTRVEEASLVKIMAASNMFGRGFSEKKLELIINELPDILVSEETDYQKTEAIANIKGMATKTAEAFVLNIDSFVEFLKECGLESKLYEAAKEPEQKDTSNPLFGKTIVMTGTRDKEIIEYLKEIGATLGSSVSSKTSLVIAKDPDDATGKVLDAKKLGIKIISVEEFKKTYM